MRRPLRRALLLTLSPLLALLIAPAPNAAAATNSGFNDWTCTPSAAHPDPLVLIHGLGSSGDMNWNYLGPAFAQAGYCAYSLTYGQKFAGGPGGMAPISDSAQQVASFIDKVRSSTGAAKVDLVGHSEGAFLSLYVPKMVSGYAAKVDRVVAMAPPTHGTTANGLVTVGELFGGQAFINAITAGVGCDACNELVTGGSAVNQLDNGPIAQPGITYTILATRNDQIVTPPSTAFVSESGVTNEYVQDTCGSDPVGHVGLAVDSDVAKLDTNALDPATATPVQCGYGPPF